MFARLSWDSGSSCNECLYNDNVSNGKVKTAGTYRELASESEAYLTFIQLFCSLAVPHIDLVVRPDVSQPEGLQFKSWLDEGLSLWSIPSLNTV